MDEDPSFHTLDDFGEWSRQGLQIQQEAGEERKRKREKDQLAKIRKRLHTCGEPPPPMWRPGNKTLTQEEYEAEKARISASKIDFILKEKMQHQEREETEKRRKEEGPQSKSLEGVAIHGRVVKESEVETEEITPSKREPLKISVDLRKTLPNPANINKKVQKVRDMGRERGYTQMLGLVYDPRDPLYVRLDHPEACVNCARKCAGLKACNPFCAECRRNRKAK